MMHRLNRSRTCKHGFTLVELLVTISIIGLLASFVLFAMAGAQESAKRDRTRAQIARIDALLSEKWESYATRRVTPFVRRYQPHTDGPMGNNGQEIRRGDPRFRTASTVARVDGIRELMRMELPARKSDLLLPAVVLRESPFLTRAYLSKAAKMLAKQKGSPLNGPSEIDSRWSTTHQGAECLYLILSQMIDEESSALRYFYDTEIGDVDADGMPEILDAWGSPIAFLRWAPGFGWNDTSNPPIAYLAGAIQDRESKDAFDPAGVYAVQGTFAMYPLVFSAGPDRLYEINISPNRNFSSSIPPNNPYVGLGNYAVSDDLPAGAWVDTNQNGQNDSIDNLHKHLLITGN